MTEFYFVRHGQTATNLKHGFNGGNTDTPLTPLGISQARTTGQALASIRFTQAICSSMPRAVKTTQLILGENQYGASIPVHPANQLREFIFGRWEGLPVSALDEPEALDAFFTDPVKFDRDFAAGVGSERYEDVLNRARSVIETAANTYPNGQILVVAHGLLFLILLNVLAGADLGTVRENNVMVNAGVTKMTTTDGKHFTVDYWADTIKRPYQPK